MVQKSYFNRTNLFRWGILVLLLLIPSTTLAETRVIFFTARSCGWCPSFKEALENPEIQKLIKDNYKYYEVVYEDNKEWFKKYAYKYYGVTGFPTLVIADTEKVSEKNLGGVLTSQSGLVTIDERRDRSYLIQNTRDWIKNTLNKFKPIKPIKPIKRMRFRR